MTSRVLTGPLWMCRSVLTEGPCVTLAWPVLSGCPSLIGHFQHLLEPGLTASGNWATGSLARGFSNNSCSNFIRWSWSKIGRSASTVVEFPEARGSESVIACRHSALCACWLVLYTPSSLPVFCFSSQLPVKCSVVHWELGLIQRLTNRNVAKYNNKFKCVPT